MPDLFNTRVTNHDGLRRVTYEPPPRAPRPHREGLRREHAKATRDAAFREHTASGTAATQRHRLLAVYAKHVPLAHAKYGALGLTDREAALCYGAEHGEPLAVTSVNGRRGDLLKHEPPLVERAEDRPCRSPDASGRNVSTWRLTPAGEAYLSQTEANR